MSMWLGASLQLLYLGQHGQLVAQAFLDVLRLVFPHKAVLFLRPQKSEQRGFLFLCKSVKPPYFVYQSNFVHTILLFVNTNIVKAESRDKRKRMFSSLAMPRRILYSVRSTKYSESRE